MDTATYLYCVAKAQTKPSLAGIPPGLPGAAPPRVQGIAGSLWLVVSQVPLDVYGPGRLESCLSDIEWVGRIAVAHEAVVEHVASGKGVTVVPMKLFTMFSSVERAAADIAARRSLIERAVKRIAGAEEWGVRILRTVPAAAASSLPAAAPASGAAFLAAKKQKRDESRSARAAAAVAAVAAFERLGRLAKDTKRREDEAPAAGAARPLLDAAFLVPVGRRAAFTAAAREEAEACARAGAQLTLSGPWPAYNFIPAGDR